MDSTQFQLKKNPAVFLWRGGLGRNPQFDSKICMEMQNSFEKGEKS